MTTIHAPQLTIHPGADRAEKTAPTTRSGRPNLSAAQQFAGVMVLSIIVVFAFSMALMLAVTPVGIGAAAGFSAYATAWLGVGFGVVFGGPFVFKGDH